MAKNSLAVEIAGRKISKSFYDWLAAEVVSSGVDNTYLDDFTQAREKLALDYESNENWAAEKQKGHLNRLQKIWWPEFAEDPQSDKASAQLVFSA